MQTGRSDAKKLLLINSVCGIGSTGKICADLAERYEQRGVEVKIAYGRNRPEEIPEAVRKYAVRIGGKTDLYVHLLVTRAFDRHGLASATATRKFLRWAEDFHPDILWLHNLHGYYIHYELLFDWIKRHPEMEVRWTLHDCWAFTGHCAHYIAAGCDRWKRQCFCCPQKHQYPASCWIDHSKDNYLRKKRSFTGVPNLTLIAPSEWLAQQVRQSFLKDYPVRVERNTVNKEVFHRRTQVEIDQTYQKYIGAAPSQLGRRILLGVASLWTEKKGLYDFYKIADLLNRRGMVAGDKERFWIVLVGLKKSQCEEIQKKYTRSDLRCVIYPVARTDSAEELACFYSGASVFVNPTVEDTFPTVNLEAKACGARIITYDVGGCRETITVEDALVPAGAVEQLVEAIRRC